MEAMITMHEQRDRAQARASGMRTWMLVNGRAYIVRSRSQDGFYIVQTAGGEIVSCDCPSWHYRYLCKHAEAVLKRLRRERGGA